MNLKTRKETIPTKLKCGIRYRLKSWSKCLYRIKSNNESKNKNESYSNKKIKRIIENQNSKSPSAGKAKPQTN